MCYGRRGAWHWDKRDYSTVYPPQNFSFPPPNVDAPIITYLLQCMNEASSTLQPWSQQGAA